MKALPEIAVTAYELRKAGLIGLRVQLAKRNISSSPNLHELQGKKLTDIRRHKDAIALRAGDFAVTITRGDFIYSDRNIQAPWGTALELRFQNPKLCHEAQPALFLVGNSEWEIGLRPNPAIDPLSPGTPEEFHEKLRAAPLSMTIAQWLTDSTRIAGIDSFYLSEILLVARIHPYALACSLNEQLSDDLRDACYNVMKQCISHGGRGDFRGPLHKDPGTAEIAFTATPGYPCPHDPSHTITRTPEGIAVCPVCQRV